MEILKNSLSFNELYWHDAIIKNIVIDRSNPGNKDSIIFEVNWPIEAKEKRNILIFKDVYLAKFNLNFGIVSDENVLNAFESNTGEFEIRETYQRWNGYLDNLHLKCYKINLNSTGGEIIIVCTDFELEFKAKKRGSN